MRFLIVFALILAAALPASAAPKWTIALFLNGNNDLDRFLDGDIAELTQAAANPDVRLVAQLARRGQPARRVVFEPTGMRVLSELGVVDMGDAKTLTDFFRWAAAEYPAERFGLVLWDHGSGWEKKGISHDEITGHQISTENLGIALDQCKQVLGRKLDIVAMDACLMMMVEVLFCVGQSCDYVVASEEAVPGTGYPYADVMAGLKVDTTPEAFATHWSQAYVEWYRREFAGTNKHATQSAVRTRDLPALYDACEELSGLVISGGHAKVVQQCLEIVVKFLTFGRTNVDLGQLCDLIAERTQDDKMLAACARVKAALKNVVLTVGSGGEAELGKTQGIAIYFPRKPTSHNHAYGRIPWARAHTWGRMVWLYFKELGLAWAN